MTLAVHAVLNECSKCVAASGPALKALIAAASASERTWAPPRSTTARDSSVISLDSANAAELTIRSTIAARTGSCSTTVSTRSRSPSDEIAIATNSSANGGMTGRLLRLSSISSARPSTMDPLRV